MKIKLNELRNLISEILLTEGAMSFDEMMNRPDLQKLILIAKDKYSEFLGKNLDYEQFKQELFNLENQGIEGTVVYRSTFTFFLISLLSKQGYLLNQNSINNISEFLQLLKNTKSKAYVSRSNFFNTDVINFLSSNGIAVSPKIMNIPLQDRVLKVYDQYQQLTGSDLISDLLSGIIKENSEFITSFAGFEQEFIDYCIQNQYWFPINSDLDKNNILTFYISNSREFEKNYKSLLYACNIQNKKRPYNELAGEVKREMSDNQYIKDVPDNMYLVMKNNDTYKIRETANWCIKSDKILRDRYKNIPGMILVLDNNKAFDDPDGCLLIELKDDKNLGDVFNAADSLINLPQYLNTLEYYNARIKELERISTSPRILSTEDAALVRIYMLLKSFAYLPKDSTFTEPFIECIERKDMLNSNIPDSSLNLFTIDELINWNKNFKNSYTILLEKKFYGIEPLYEFLNIFPNEDIRQNKKLILPLDMNNTNINNIDLNLIDNDLKIFPLNTIKDLQYILDLIYTKKINYYFDNNFLNIKSNGEIFLDPNKQNKVMNESLLRTLIRGYIKLLK